MSGVASSTIHVRFTWWPTWTRVRGGEVVAWALPVYLAGLRAVAARFGWALTARGLWRFYVQGDR